MEEKKLIFKRSDLRKDFTRKHWNKMQNRFLRCREIIEGGCHAEGQFLLIIK